MGYINRLIYRWRLGLDDFARQASVRHLWQPLMAIGLVAAPLTAWQISLALDSSRPVKNVQQTTNLNNNTSELADELNGQVDSKLYTESELSDKSSSRSSSVRIKQQVSVKGNQRSSDKTTTEVKVNGQPVNVPSNGELHKTIKSPGGGQTTIDISSTEEADSSGDESHASVNLQVETHSSNGAVDD